MDGWSTFSDYFQGQPAHYSVVSEEYGDYCAAFIQNAAYSEVYTPIKELVAALEEIVLNESTAPA